MVLQMLDHSGQLVHILDDLDKKLGYYSPEDGYGIHVSDPPQRKPLQNHRHH